MQLSAYSSANSPCHWRAGSHQCPKAYHYVPHGVVWVLSETEVYQAWESARAELVKEAFQKTWLKRCIDLRDGKGPNRDLYIQRFYKAFEVVYEVGRDVQTYRGLVPT